MRGDPETIHLAQQHSQPKPRVLLRSFTAANKKEQNRNTATEKKNSTPRDGTDRKSLRQASTTKPPNDLYNTACLRLMDFAELHGLHILCWGRERNAYAPLEKNWLVRIGHTAMHQRAIPVPIDVRM